MLAHKGKEAPPRNAFTRDSESGKCKNLSEDYTIQECSLSLEI